MQLFNSEKLIVGLALGGEDCQMSYISDQEAEAQSLSYSGVPEEINMPVVLTKRNRVNQWFYGAEAKQYSEDNGTVLIDNLFEHAVNGEVFSLEEREYDYKKLLALFVKRALNAVNSVGGIDKTECLVITCDELTQGALRTLDEIKTGLHLKNTRIETISYAEAFYAYAVRQPAELWSHSSVLIRQEKSKLVSYVLSSNKNTKPIAVNVERKEFEFADMQTLIEEKAYDTLDSAFMHILPEILGNITVDSVYLCGQAFVEDWMKDSLKYLCKNRRVFLGDNLFSKGAAYCLAEKYHPTMLSDTYIYLGEDKVKINIGMDILSKGKKTYWALLDAGVSFFDADVTFEFYMNNCKEVDFMITPIMGEKVMKVSVKTPEAEDRVLRAQCYISFKDANSVCIEIMDRGLGKIHPSTGVVWKQEFHMDLGE